MYVLSISSISEVLMDFTLDCYFRQIWKDPRLSYESPVGITTLAVGAEFLNKIWVPDTFFVNEKTSYFHTATTANEFLRISSDGDILRSMRLTVTASCYMDLRHFPMDAQLCNVEIESYGYSMSDIRYKWARGPTSVGVSNKVSLPQFKVLGFRQKASEISLLSGNYSRLSCEIQFVRSTGYYLIQVYIPSTLIVIMSWVSFWLNRVATPARVQLGISTVLTMTTLMSSTNKELPKVSYVKSIDIFLGTCFVLVFAALIEYATVGYLAKRIQMRKKHFADLQKMAKELQTKREEEAKVSEEADEAIRQFHMRNTQSPYPHYSKTASSVQNYPPYQQVHSRSIGRDLYRGEFDDIRSLPGTLSRSRGPRGPEYWQTRDQIRKEEKIREQQVEDLEKTLRKIRVYVESNQICGIAPSDIDKYSRVIFPVCFACFHLGYWIVYMHISKVDIGDLTLVHD